MSIPCRHSAGFGKRIEYWVVGLMLKNGMDIYMPLVDDNGIDAVIRKSDGTFIESQVKARSKTVAMGDAAMFAAITHEKRNNYYFVFYSECLNTFWIMSSEEFMQNQVKTKMVKILASVQSGLMGNIKIKKPESTKNTAMRNFPNIWRLISRDW